MSILTLSAETKKARALKINEAEKMVMEGN
jgi:hypothetical protein